LNRPKPVHSDMDWLRTVQSLIGLIWMDWLRTVQSLIGSIWMDWLRMVQPLIGLIWMDWLRTVQSLIGSIWMDWFRTVQSQHFLQREHITFWWDNDVCFVLDQHVELEFHKAQSTNLQSMMHNIHIFWQNFCYLLVFLVPPTKCMSSLLTKTSVTMKNCSEHFVWWKKQISLSFFYVY
jgi:hypothetical protein